MDLPTHPAPYRIRTPRLLLRCPEVDDIPAVHEGVLETVDLLAPWMPWVEGEPVPLSQRTRDIERLRGGFERNEDFTYMVFDAETDEFVGGMGLHPRVGAAGVEVGYWVRTRRQGHGLAGEGTSALIRTAFEHLGVDRVEMRIEPENGPSHRVMEKLGIRREALLRRRFLRGGELRDVHVFTIFRSEFAGSRASAIEAHCFDEKGAPVPPRFRVQP
ncbi:MAG: hypothetical protein DHS20C21_16000 [Gemmatimonadota bacterium]|nr:MAG: hypothetical protein DHS20C21_16000 [Gemmatimonadota bacterium]